MNVFSWIFVFFSIWFIIFLNGSIWYNGTICHSYFYSCLYLLSFKKLVVQNHLILLIFCFFSPANVFFFSGAKRNNKNLISFYQKLLVKTRNKNLSKNYISKRFFYRKSRFNEMIFYGCNNGDNRYDGFDTIIAHDLLNKNQGLFSCPKCKCICLNPNNEKYFLLKDMYIRNKAMVYWYFDSTFDTQYFGPNRFAWIYDPCSSKMDLKLAAWLKSGKSEFYTPEFENFKAFDGSANIISHDFRDECTNNVVYLWRLRNFHKLYYLDYEDFSKGNFDIEGTHIFYLNGIFISVNDKSDEYIDFEWIRVINDINDDDNDFDVKCFGDFRYYGNYIFDIKKKRLILESNFEIPPIFKDFCLWDKYI